MDKKENNNENTIFNAYDWKKKVILVVEDVDTSNMYFKAALHRTKAKVLWAENGKDAVKFCKSNKDIDVVLMDIHLPKMNGFEATKEIKKFRKDLPVIIQTAYVLSGEEAKSYEAGCDEFITKPIKFKKLLSTIDKYLK